MKGRIDLTQGKITEKLVKLSLPIMATSFIQMDPWRSSFAIKIFKL